MDAVPFQTLHRIGPFSKFLIKVAAADLETLRLCPPSDLDNVKAVAEIMLGTWVYQILLFFTVGQTVFTAPGQLRLELLLPAALIASFILLIDSYIVMRSGWHLSGIAELKRGGLDISGGFIARLKAGCFLIIRLLLAVGLAQLTAVFLSLLIFKADIDTYNRGLYLQANAHLVGGATALVDQQIQRATEAVAAETKRNAALSAQVTGLRQGAIGPTGSDPDFEQARAELNRLFDEKVKADAAVQTAETFSTDELAGIQGVPGNSGRAGAGPRHKAALEQVANARAHAAAVGEALAAARARLDALNRQLETPNEAVKQRAQTQLSGFESDFAAETARLAALQDQLNGLIQGRDDAIRQAIDNAPDHVGSNDGLLGRITALEAIARDDTKIFSIIVLIDIVSFGFELAAVLAKVTAYIPSTYAALLARDSYLQAVRIVEDMVAQLKRRPPGEAQTSTAPTLDELVDEQDEAEGPANDNATNGSVLHQQAGFDAPDDDPPPTPRRPRGRPRKTPLN